MGKKQRLPRDYHFNSNCDPNSREITCRHRRAAANYTMGAIEGVFTEKAPKPLPQFSQAVKYNGMVYVSGNIGLDAATWKVVEGTVKDRTVRMQLTLLR